MQESKNLFYLTQSGFEVDAASAGFVEPAQSQFAQIHSSFEKVKNYDDVSTNG